MKSIWLKSIMLLLIFGLNACLVSTTSSPANPPKGNPPIGDTDPAPLPELRAVVIYNNNYPPSKEIAEYYAQARQIPESHLCPVEVAIRDYVGGAEAENARRQILKCFCKVYDPTINLHSCVRSNEELLTKLYETELDYLVFIKGMPRQILVPGEAWELASFDDAMAKVIFRSVDLVSNSFSRQMLYGRIEAVSTASTKDLVDRIINAEKKGFQGNSFLGAQIEYDDDTVSNDRSLMKDLFPLACYHNVTPNWTASATLWDSESCNFAWTRNMAPSATIPYFLNAGLFVSANPLVTEQRPFDGSFANSLQWRKSSGACTPLCKNMGSAGQIAACRADSKDIFKTINTDCVGTSENMMGYQLRSFPTARMELPPAGWEAANSITLEQNDAFINSRFTDHHYLRFGPEEIVPPAQTACAAGSGSLECVPDLGWGAAWVKTTIATDIPGSATLQKILIRFRLRNNSSGEPSACDRGKFSVVANFKDAEGNSLHSLDAEDCSGGTVRDENRMMYAYTGVARPNWVTVEKIIDLPGLTAGKRLRSIDFAIRAEKTHKGYFDLDAIEIIHVNTGSDLLTAEQGSFALPDNEDNYSEGTFHSVMFERFGAVAWWGNDGHYITWGWGYNKSMKAVKNFFNGLPLGQAILAQENRSITSHIYGDPLYNPISLSITSDLGPPLADKVHVDSTNFKLYVRAFNGRDHASAQSWNLERYTGSEWVSVATGRAGSHRALAVANVRELIPGMKVSGNQVQLRLSLTGAGAQPKIKNIYTLEHQ